MGWGFVCEARRESIIGQGGAPREQPSRDAPAWARHTKSQTASDGAEVTGEHAPLAPSPVARSAATDVEPVPACL